MPITVFDAVGKFSADTRNLDEFVTKLDRALPDASQKSAVATKILKDAQDNLKNSLKALRQEGGDTAENWKKVADAQRQVAIASGANKQAHDDLNRSIGNVKESSKEAKGEAALLGDMFGITLPRHVRNFIAEMPGIQTALKGAFAATAVYFLIEAMTEVPEKIKTITSDLAGWTKEAQAAYEAQRKLNEQLLDLADKREESKKREQERGLDGVQLTRQQLTDDRSINELQRERIVLAGKKLGQLLQEKQENEAVLQGWGAATIAEAFYLTDRKEKVKELQKEIDAIQDRILKFAKERGDNEQQQADRSSQLSHQATADFIAQESAKTEARRIQANTSLELFLAATRNEVAAGVSTNQQLLAEDQRANEQRYQNDLKAAQDKLALLKLDPTRNRDAIVALNSSIEAMQAQHYAQMLDLDTEYTEEHKRLAALQNDPQLVSELALFNAQIEQAEQLHNGKMLKITIDGLQAIAQTKQQLQEQIDKGDFSQSIKQTINLSVNDQQLVDATNILAKLGDQTAGVTKRAGEAQAAYDLLVFTIQAGDQRALGSQRLLTDSLTDFKQQLESIGNNPTLLLGLNDVIKQEIEATDAWGGSTTELEHKLADVQHRLASIGIVIDDIGKKSSKALSPITNVFKQLITGSTTAGKAAKQFGMITAEGIGMSVAAAVQGSESFGQAMQQFLKTTLSTLAGEAIVQAIVEMAKGFAAMSPTSPDFGHSGEHFTSAAIWGTVGAAAAIAGSAIPSGAGSGSAETAGAPAGTQPIATQGAAATPDAAPVQTVNTQHFATGALFTGRTMAVMGDAIGGGDQLEAAYPLEGPTADLVAEKISGKITAPVVHVHVHGKSLSHLIKEINHAVDKGGHNLIASQSRSVRRKS